MSWLVEEALNFTSNTHSFLMLCVYTEVPGKVAGNSIEVKIYMFRGTATTTKGTQPFVVVQCHIIWEFMTPPHKRVLCRLFTYFFTTLKYQAKKKE